MSSRERVGPSLGVVLSASVALAAVALYASTFFFDLEYAIELFEAVTVGSIVCIASMVACLRASNGTEIRKAPNDSSVLRGIQRTGLAVKSIPPSLLFVFFVVLAFFFVNLVVLISTMSSGSPVERDGMFMLTDHGRFVRILTRGEFLHLKTLEVRGLVGQSVVFSTASVLGFVVRRKWTAASG